MDLLGAARTLRQIADVFGDGPDSGEPWATDEESFARHFGATYEDFRAVLGFLDEEQATRFDSTMKVNPEAAVLWVLAMEPT